MMMMMTTNEPLEVHSLPDHPVEQRVGGQEAEQAVRRERGHPQQRGAQRARPRGPAQPRAAVGLRAAGPALQRPHPHLRGTLGSEWTVYMVLGDVAGVPTKLICFGF